MRNENNFIEYLKNRKASEESIAFSVDFIHQYETFSADFTNDQTEEKLESIKAFCTEFIAGKENALEKIIALARYSMFSENENAITYLITMFGTIGVLESMEERLTELVGENEALDIFGSIVKPPLGSVYEFYPPVVNKLLETMQQYLPLSTCQEVLAGNHHRVSVEGFQKDKEKYEELGSLDALLSYQHLQLLNELVECMLGDKLWYEQKITPAVLEFVRNNREIQTGVREGNKLFITKIPYQPDAFLKETDPQKKRYLACHCPFVRSSILDNSSKVPKLWCYCTGGYIKLRYDVIFGKSLEVKLLETVLDGDDRCRFVITLPPETKD